MKYGFIIFLFTIFITEIFYAQNPNIKWKRSEVKISEIVQPFHSTHAINLPTTETIQKGNLEFEISHRFVPDIKSGSKDLFGFDGPVNIRIALGYGITDNTFLTLGRSNLNDNVDLWLKQKLWNFNNDLLPFALAFRIGSAYNSEAFDLNANEAKEFQYFVQLILNSSIERNFAFGIVPSYLYNSYIFIDDKKYSFTLGTNLQYYLSEIFSVLFEWNPTITGFRIAHNPASFGIELETGGHFFKIVLSNSTELNSSQFLAGTRSSFNESEWHIGFNITRLLNL